MDQGRRRHKNKFTIGKLSMKSHHAMILKTFI